MTYALAEPLQMAIYAALTSDPALTALVGSNIYDAPIPLEGTTPTNFVLIGAEQVSNGGAKDVGGAVHDLSITVHSNEDGFATGKRIAGAVCDVLLDAQLPMARGKLVYLRFLKARADAVEAPAKRTVLLRFRAFVEDSSN